MCPIEAVLTLKGKRTIARPPVGERGAQLNFTAATGERASFHLTSEPAGGIVKNQSSQDFNVACTDINTAFITGDIQLNPNEEIGFDLPNKTNDGKDTLIFRGT